jgi:hypothetical protein
MIFYNKKDMSNKNEIVMGLDISTKCIGVAIYDLNNKKIIEITHVAPKIDSKIKGIEQLFLKKRIFEEFLLEYADKGITKVVIEEPLLRSNNVNTVDILSKFNGMISDSVYRILGIVPEYISSYDARKYAFPELMAIRKFNKKGEEYSKDKILTAIKKNKLVLFGEYPFDCDKKLILWNKISELYPYIPWVYDKKGELKKENFDASDALVTCLAICNKIEFGEAEFNITSSDNVKSSEISYLMEVWDKKIPKKIIID